MGLKDLVSEGFSVLKDVLLLMIERQHYVPMPEAVLKRQSPVAVKYISKRLQSIIWECPYSVEFVEFDSDTQNGFAKATLGGKRIIQIKESNPTQTQFETLIHEWSHVILHLRRNAIEVSEVTEEFEAEAVSFIVGYIIGVIDDLSHAYIYEKIKSVEPDRARQRDVVERICEDSNERISKTAMKIISKLSTTRRMIEYHEKCEGKKL